jgi:hypothetical protein
MAAADSNDRLLPVRSTPRPPLTGLAARFRQFFDQHSEASRQERLPDAYRRDLNARALDRWSPRPPLTEEDIRLHAWLAERLAVVNYEKHGLWPRLRRFLLGNRLVRWLTAPSPRTKTGQDRWRPSAN